MKKVTKSVSVFVGVVSVAWWLGGMMYFLMVVRHFKDQEHYENLSKNLASYIRNIDFGVGNDAPIHADKGDKSEPKSAPRVIRDLGNQQIKPKGTYPKQISADPDSKWKSYYRPHFGRDTWWS